MSFKQNVKTLRGQRTDYATGDQHLYHRQQLQQGVHAPYDLKLTTTMQKVRANVLRRQKLKLKRKKLNESYNWKYRHAP